MEYWLIDSTSGHGNGCYLSLNEALQAAERELRDRPRENLSLLGMASHQRAPQSERRPEPEQRVFVRFELGTTDKP